MAPTSEGGGEAIVKSSLVALLLIVTAVVWQHPAATQANGIAFVSAGTQHTCAVTTEGGAKCWGFNQWGQLGDGTTTNRNTAIP